MVFRCKFFKLLHVTKDNTYTLCIYFIIHFMNIEEKLYKNVFTGRQWTYQTCTEFGFFQTSNQKDSAFSNQFPLDLFIDMCTDTFGNL